MGGGVAFLTRPWCCGCNPCSKGYAGAASYSCYCSTTSGCTFERSISMTSSFSLRAAGSPALLQQQRYLCKNIRCLHVAGASNVMNTTTTSSSSSEAAVSLTPADIFSAPYSHSAWVTSQFPRRTAAVARRRQHTAGLAMSNTRTSTRSPQSFFALSASAPDARMHAATETLIYPSTSISVAGLTKAKAAHSLTGTQARASRTAAPAELSDRKVRLFTRTTLSIQPVLLCRSSAASIVNTTDFFCRGSSHESSTSQPRSISVCNSATTTLPSSRQRSPVVAPKSCLNPTVSAVTTSVIESDGSRPAAAAPLTPSAAPTAVGCSLCPSRASAAKVTTSHPATNCVANTPLLALPLHSAGVCATSLPPAAGAADANKSPVTSVSSTPAPIQSLPFYAVGRTMPGQRLLPLTPADAAVLRDSVVRYPNPQEVEGGIIVRLVRRCDPVTSPVLRCIHNTQFGIRGNERWQLLFVGSAGTAILVGLGCWQLRRMHEKREIIEYRRKQLRRKPVFIKAGPFPWAVEAATQPAVPANNQTLVKERDQSLRHQQLEQKTEHHQNRQVSVELCSYQQFQAHNNREVIEAPDREKRHQQHNDESKDGYRQKAAPSGGACQEFCHQDSGPSVSALASLFFQQLLSYVQVIFARAEDAVYAVGSKDAIAGGTSPNAVASVAAFPTVTSISDGNNVTSHPGPTGKFSLPAEQLGTDPAIGVATERQTPQDTSGSLRGGIGFPATISAAIEETRNIKLTTACARGMVLAADAEAGVSRVASGEEKEEATDHSPGTVSISQHIRSGAIGSGTTARSSGETKTSTSEDEVLREWSYRPVVVRGVLDTSIELQVGPRPGIENGSTGCCIISPLRLEDGQILLINKGHLLLPRARLPAFDSTQALQLRRRQRLLQQQQQQHLGKQQQQQVRHQTPPLALCDSSSNSDTCTTSSSSSTCNNDSTGSSSNTCGSSRSSHIRKGVTTSYTLEEQGRPRAAPESAAIVAMQLGANSRDKIGDDTEATDRKGGERRTMCDKGWLMSALEKDNFAATPQNAADWYNVGGKFNGGSSSTYSGPRLTSRDEPPGWVTVRGVLEPGELLPNAAARGFFSWLHAGNRPKENQFLYVVPKDFVEALAPRGIIRDIAATSMFVVNAYDILYDEDILTALQKQSSEQKRLQKKRQQREQQCQGPVQQDRDGPHQQHRDGSMQQQREGTLPQQGDEPEHQQRDGSLQHKREDSLRQQRECLQPQERESSLQHPREVTMLHVKAQEHEVLSQPLQRQKGQGLRQCKGSLLPVKIAADTQQSMPVRHVQSTRRSEQDIQQERQQQGTHACGGAATQADNALGLRIGLLLKDGYVARSTLSCRSSASRATLLQSTATTPPENESSAGTQSGFPRGSLRQRLDAHRDTHAPECAATECSKNDAVVDTTITTHPKFSSSDADLNTATTAAACVVPLASDHIAAMESTSNAFSGVNPDVAAIASVARAPSTAHEKSAVARIPLTATNVLFPRSVAAMYEHPSSLSALLRIPGIRRRFADYQQKRKDDYLLFWADEHTHFNYACQWFLMALCCACMTLYKFVEVSRWKY